MNREIIRKQYEESGLSYSDISSKDFFKLRKMLSEELKVFSCLKMKVTKHKEKHLTFKDDGVISHGGIRVKSSYFDDREAITFNMDGFVGFAGWADSTNVQPFLNAFSKFINLKTKKRP